MMSGPFCDLCLKTRYAMWDACCKAGAVDGGDTRIQLYRKGRNIKFGKHPGKTCFLVEFDVSDWELRHYFYAASIHKAVAMSIRWAREKGVKFKKHPKMLVKNFFTDKMEMVKVGNP